ncbi:MAG: tRNA uridine-5-carboxymethylaminomethyl(34) synthesis GTPase MnmE [Deltaproteobacteria bacterium]|nr:tRNA uridine-5-carboxymethylaminomethyl(34) synthesis GTPase MnmE [Deltaproteobacteria bacterium]
MGDLDETIAAPITAAGHSAISVVRISGPLTRQAIESLVVQAKRVIDNPRKLMLVDIRHLKYSDYSHVEAELLDSGMVVYFPRFRSFTGEDSAEFNIHGSPFLVEKLLESLCACGLRLANPGEFCKRAFLNGKLDLVQAEAIADLIAAESETQARAAKHQLAGALSAAISQLGEQVKNCLAELEAFIDFPEEDIETASEFAINLMLKEAVTAIDRLLESFRTGKLYREGAQVVIVGYPNAGKSSILNRLVGEERAIVSQYAGTTRDAIEERISLDGLLIRLWDTAGIIDSTLPSDEVSRLNLMGVEQSWLRVENADLAVFVFDVTEDVDGLEKLFRQVIAKVNNVVAVGNKCDLLSEEQLIELKLHVQEVFGAAEALEPLFVSATNGQGFRELKRAIRGKLLMNSSASIGAIVTNFRHRDCLLEARKALEEGLSNLKASTAVELIASDIRQALSSLSDIIGVTSSEDILERIFSKFCIGK